MTAPSVSGADNRLRGGPVAALTVHRTVIHSCDCASLTPIPCGTGEPGDDRKGRPYAGRGGAKCRCRWCRGKAGWNVHHGYILHLIGMDDGDIARELGIAESAVAKRRRSAWIHGRA